MQSHNWAIKNIVSSKWSTKCDDSAALRAYHEPAVLRWQSTSLMGRHTGLKVRAEPTPRFWPKLLQRANFDQVVVSWAAVETENNSPTKTCKEHRTTAITSRDGGSGEEISSLRSSCFPRCMNSPLQGVKGVLIGCWKRAGEINSCRLLFRFHLASGGLGVFFIFFFFIFGWTKPETQCEMHQSLRLLEIWCAVTSELHHGVCLPQLGVPSLIPPSLSSLEHSWWQPSISSYFKSFWKRSPFLFFSLVAYGSIENFPVRSVLMFGSRK